MSGKGSKPRPIEIDRTIFEGNWDRIFKDEKTMWEHNCKHNGKMSIGRGEDCSWCGEREDENRQA